MPDSNTQRSAALWSWFLALCEAHALGTPQGTIEPVSGDASFRRYFRGSTAGHSWILVDAPPEHEDSRRFLAVQGLLQGGGVRVPRVLASDLDAGFLCLEDFGGELLLTRLLDPARPAQALPWYRAAFAELAKIQSCTDRAAALPDYDDALLRREMALFRDWLCQACLALSFSPAEQRLWQALQDLLVSAALAQPRVFVHRDYHARNLMVLDGNAAVPTLGVIDFQDAVLGPCTYDLVSLLKDCYVAWPAESVRQWALDWLALARSQAALAERYRMDDGAFLQAFDLMGVQRHLKAAGIFCRLWLRDGKPGYLQDVPRTLGYITRIEATGCLADFQDLLRARVLPAFSAHLQRLQQEGVLP